VAQAGAAAAGPDGLQEAHGRRLAGPRVQPDDRRQRRRGGKRGLLQGLPEVTRISSIVTSATATSKAQFLVSFKMNMSSFENRWRIEADNRFFWTSQPTYGLGTDTPEAAKLDMKFNHLRIFDKYYQQVRRNVFLGAGYVYNIHNNVRAPDEVDPEALPTRPTSPTRRVRLRPRLPDLERRQPPRPRRQP
jgi:hypothetical protein